jgi:hypothetical protein
MCGFFYSLTILAVRNCSICNGWNRIIQFSFEQQGLHFHLQFLLHHKTNYLHSSIFLIPLSFIGILFSYLLCKHISSVVHSFFLLLFLKRVYAELFLFIITVLNFMLVLAIPVH